jgi:hypothetical protein
MNPCPKHVDRKVWPDGPCSGCFACTYERDPQRAPWTPERTKSAEDALREWKEVESTVLRRIADFNDDNVEELDIAIFKEQK